MNIFVVKIFLEILANVKMVIKLIIKNGDTAKNIIYIIVWQTWKFKAQMSYF